MPTKKRSTQQKKQSGVLIKAATTLGRAAGKIARLVGRGKSAQAPARTRRKVSSKKMHTTSRRKPQRRKPVLED